MAKLRIRTKAEKDAERAEREAKEQARQKVQAKKGKPNASYTPDEWAALTIDERLEILAKRAGILKKD